jgi:hypothetical protein
MFYKIIYMHILVHIYVSYAILNNIFVYFGRISRSTEQDYQLVVLEQRGNCVAEHLNTTIRTFDSLK